MFKNQPKNEGIVNTVKKFSIGVTNEDSSTTKQHGKKKIEGHAQLAQEIIIQVTKICNKCGVKLCFT